MERFKRAAAAAASNGAALALAALLFAGAFPNRIFQDGCWPLAWLAYAPVFRLVRRTGYAGAALWGALYGFLSYALFNSWLGGFHPLAGVIVYAIYSGYMAALFPLLKAAAELFPRRGYLVQWLLWLAYEYLRTLGFLGYPYGVTGYSQWTVLPLIQIASVFGVWGVSALVAFPSAYLAGALAELGRIRARGREGREAIAGALLSFLRRERSAGMLWLAALAATLAYGLASPVDYAGAPRARVVLVQHNTDPWVGGFEAYSRNFETLRRLSLEGLAAAPDADLVAWSETAFVPRIDWHLRYREDEAYFRLVSELMDFLAGRETPFLIGNHDARLESGAGGAAARRDYNAALLFEGGREAGAYRKERLVPFTEHFPYREAFPGVYAALEAADTHFWDPGSGPAVLETAAGLRFSAPICFEDSFGYLSRRAARDGARLIVNLTNDAWAKSLPAQTQHMAMAVFRAVENRRSVLRAAASGQTCAIDPNGRVMALAEPFVEAWLLADAPLMDLRTPYMALGDALGAGFVAAAAIAMAFGAGYRLGTSLRRARARSAV